MKILCMVDRFRKYDEIYKCPLITELKKYFPNDEVVAEYWTEVSDDFIEIVRKIETDGPSAFKIPEAFIRHKDAEILVGGFCPFSKEGLAIFHNLRVLGVERAGLENVDVSGAEELGIMVVNAAGRNADSVSDFAIAMMMAENRKIGFAHNNMMNGLFNEKMSNENTMMDMRGRVVGIFGFGYIGKLVAEKLSGFKMKILVYDPFVSEDQAKKYKAKLVDKDTLFKESDFITIHARLTDDTYHVIGERELNLMKKNAVIVNTARSGLMDYNALIKVLGEHRIAGAALDVYDNEPLERESKLFQLDNVTLTPHIAGMTHDAAIYSPHLTATRVKCAAYGENTQMLTPIIKENSKYQDWVKNNQAK